MRHEAMYDEQDGPDDAPFLGGSTEQKDTWLADRQGPALGATRVGSAAFRVAFHEAAEQLHAPVTVPVIDLAEERAFLVAAMGPQPYPSMNILRGYLYAERRHAVGRPLTEPEWTRIEQFAQQAWGGQADGVAA